MDDLGFVASKDPIKEVAISLEKISEAVLELRLVNAVIFDIAKTKAILISIACNKKVKKEIINTRLVFRRQEVKFNNIATR